jgi:pyruvate/2-oxoglutarate dehydrogenase complex dihydrolipoamide acyltransferase (E2) component
MINVEVPKMAEGVDKANISYWHRKVGEDVREGEDLVELVTDKAAFNIPSPVTGKLKSVLANEGDEVRVGQLIATID